MPSNCKQALYVLDNAIAEYHRCETSGLNHKAAVHELATSQSNIIDPE